MVWVGKCARQPLDHKVFAGAVGAGHQVVFAFHFVGYVAGEILRHQGAGLRAQSPRWFQESLPCWL
jgi:hypothetical protein